MIALLFDIADCLQQIDSYSRRWRNSSQTHIETLYKELHKKELLEVIEYNSASS